MVQVKAYKLPPTTLIPNSPYPLLHYQGLFSGPNNLRPAEIHELYANNGWRTQWIFRYGPTQQSHYHSQAHECMTVLAGQATIRFGVADTVGDLEESTHGTGREEGGIEIEARAGDVFILPAGVAHKTHDTRGSQYALLTPGGAKGVLEDGAKVLEGIELSGFTMMGAYPVGSEWDFAVGKEDDDGHFERTWGVPKPDNDPVLGKASEGLCGLWL